MKYKNFFFSLRQIRRGDTDKLSSSQLSATNHSNAFVAQKNKLHHERNANISIKLYIDELYRYFALV